MAATPTLKPRLAALDTNILIHLAEGHAPSLNLVLRLIRMGIIPVVTQTVISELAWAAKKETNRKQKVAITALTTMRQWGIQTITLKPVGNGICDVVCNVIQSRGIIPEEEKNDTCIALEASFAAAVMLLTWDGHLIEADPVALNEVLKEFDLPPIKITHPHEILQ